MKLAWMLSLLPAEGKTEKLDGALKAKLRTEGQGNMLHI